MFGCLDDVVCMFNMLKLLMMYEPCVCVRALSINNIVSINYLWVSFLGNSHETSLVL
jgi:hypothetical protein